MTTTAARGGRKSTPDGRARKEAFDAERRKRRDAKLESGLKFISERFADGISLVDVAAKVGMSLFHFHRAFSAHFGFTPKEARRMAGSEELRARLARDSAALAAPVAPGKGSLT